MAEIMGLTSTNIISYWLHSEGKVVEQFISDRGIEFDGKEIILWENPGDGVLSKYKIHPGNSIFFEVDRPYIPSSEGKNCINFMLAELQVQEEAPSDELQLIEIFQSTVSGDFGIVLL